MSACTFGFYCWYWLFQNWTRVCKIRNRKLSPFIRTWLFPHYNRSLFEEIKRLASEKGLQVSWSSRVLSAGFILFLVGWFSSYTVYISIFVGVVLVPVNNTCGILNEANCIKESWEGLNKIDFNILIFGGLFVLWGFLSLVVHSGLIQSLGKYLKPFID
jgi:hypothetical protein